MIVKEATAIIRKQGDRWIAAIALARHAETFIDATTSDSEATARQWIVRMAAQCGIDEADIRFSPAGTE
jgi:hypothetical protein